MGIHGDLVINWSPGKLGCCANFVHLMLSSSHVWSLFFSHSIRIDGKSVKGVEFCPLFIMEELEKTVHPMINKKVPEIDGIRPPYTSGCFINWPDLLLCQSTFE